MMTPVAIAAEVSNLLVRKRASHLRDKQFKTLYKVENTTRCTNKCTNIRSVILGSAGLLGKKTDHPIDRFWRRVAPTYRAVRSETELVQNLTLAVSGNRAIACERC